MARPVRVGVWPIQTATKQVPGQSRLGATRGQTSPNQENDMTKQTLTRIRLQAWNAYALAFRTSAPFSRLLSYRP